MSLTTITAVISGFLGRLRRRPRNAANPVPPAAIGLLLAGLVHLGVSHAAEFKQGEDPFQPAAKTGLDDLLKLEVPTIYGASKQTQRASEAPSAVTVISAEEVKKHGHRTLADVLASVPGFYITSDRNNAFVGVRGFNRGLYPNSRLLLLVDGHRVNNNLYDGGLVGTDFILDLDLIDRVEII